MKCPECPKCGRLLTRKKFRFNHYDDFYYWIDFCEYCGWEEQI